MLKRILIIVIVAVAASITAFLWFDAQKASPSPTKASDVQGASAEQVDREQASLDIIDKPLPPASYQEGNNTPYTHVMIHFASDAKANPSSPHDVNAVYDEFKKSEIGAHYYIDREGTIYRFIDEKYKAYHAGSKAGHLPGYPELGSAGNDYAVGIELAAIGAQEEMEIYGIDATTYALIPQEDIGYTNTQYESLKKLLDDIVQRHDIAYDRKHIIGHSEYVPERRTDPGKLFDWTRIDLKPLNNE